MTHMLTLVLSLLASPTGAIDCHAVEDQIEKTLGAVDLTCIDPPQATGGDCPGAVGEWQCSDHLGDHYCEACFCVGHNDGNGGYSCWFVACRLTNGDYTCAGWDIP